MEELWYVDRASLRALAARQPGYSKAQLAQALSRSVTWVKKWLKRFKQATADDQTVLWGLPRQPHHPRRPKPPHPLLVKRVLEIRDQPPQELRRTPGPKAILYYL